MKGLEVSKLNNYQKKVYNEIQELIEPEEETVITIDTPSGTGKTTLLCSLAVNNPSVKFLTFRRDQASEIKKMKIDAYTYVSFIMHHFNLTYTPALQMFQSFSTDNVAELYNLLVYSKKFVQNDTKVIILDTYTIPSPRILLLLFIVSLKCNLRLIFAGNSMQLGAIGKSVFHDGSNFHLIQMFTDVMINKLDKNMRTREKELEDKITSFRKILRQYKPAGDVPLHFNVRYALYTIFREKYFTQEYFDSIYIAATHRQLTSRLLRFINYLESNNVPYIKAPFYYHGRNGMKPLVVNKKRNAKKFVSYLLLVEGYRYTYISQEGEHHVVILEKILFDPTGLIRSLLVRLVKEASHLELVLCELNYYQILPAYRDWLLTDIVSTGTLWQFPLRPYTVLTYHATLGRTIEKENVELNTECKLANPLYIGLCSVRYYDKIYKIHDERNLSSFLLTEYMEKQRNDYKYYYRCPVSDNHLILQSANTNGRNQYIDNIQWNDVDSIPNFEVNVCTYYMRIEREVYENVKIEEMDTPLMRIARFVKERPDVVVNTIKAAPVNSFIGNNHNHNTKCNKKKKHQKLNDEDAEPVAYTQLKDAYEKWMEKREE
ncbi:uncharacterized protein LOC108629933 [Ceratina calcarata]|uniref:Uncharacterized protein LOC108629933 n=1 Tax=Ceratina calcarata TaxID=156304 RepID=A0AAJ7WEI6_9HYME|nr:uncharacterized protein LOC108629933 [Ceratina calcarata]XP_017888384.1 uncharacterized protein LOC108629933 [Ceratina calcarata]XP_026673506.1 uncharacterized protein LOC108629933 [Ceratina calcarata]XP_026673507.1 uncharacterized protein LOC108629933 [Ceratina calcarata]XP_026673508.1 uncharacterized protein LOC108629933 [Ceratina calcarata]